MRKSAIIAFAVLGTFLLFAFFNTDMQDAILLRKSAHRWCVTDCGGPTGAANGYSSSNSDCQNRCGLNHGISCGKNWQNCCVSNQCYSHFYGDVCQQRIPVANCTSP